VALLYGAMVRAATARRPRLGQHFLRDGRVAASIAMALPVSPSRVLEIGPGRGALTAHLVRRFERVLAVEVDATLAYRLAANLKAPAGLEVVRGDARTVDLDALTGGEQWLVAGNLPYAVATPIMRRVLTRGDRFPVAVFMVQREVAQRLVAPPGTRDRGLLTLEVELAARSELLFTVPPRCFAPPPEVTSAVVRLTMRPSEVVTADCARVLTLAAAAFTHRRKKLPNALAAVVPATLVAAALAAAGVSTDVRPEDLDLDTWLALAAALPRGDA